MIPTFSLPLFKLTSELLKTKLSPSTITPDCDFAVLLKTFTESMFALSPSM